MITRKVFWPPPVLAGRSRLNRDLMWARRGALRCAGYILLPGMTRASLRATGHVQGWVLEHLPSSKVGGTYIADAAADKTIDTGEPASNGVIEVLVPLRHLQPTHSSHPPTPPPAHPAPSPGR